MSSTNEYIKQKWGDRPQINLAKDIAKAMAKKNGIKCTRYAYKQYKGYVNKWFHTDQEPGKHYLLILSEILNVSVESILIGRDIPNNYGDRPTAYSAALSGDKYIIDRLFGNSESDIDLYTTDEYGKSFIDYVIEFNNYSAFKTAIENGYGFYNSNGALLLDISICTPEKQFKLAKMIIEHDDKDIFIQAFGKTHGGNVSQISVFYNYIFLMQSDLIFSILNTTDILSWLLQDQYFSGMEREQHTNMNIPDQERLQPIIDKIPSVFSGFNNILNMCIENNLNKQLNQMLEHGIHVVRNIMDTIKENENEFKVGDSYDYYDMDMIIQIKSLRTVIKLGYVPYVQNYQQIKDEDLRKKAIFINEEMDKLRRVK